MAAYIQHESPTISGLMVIIHHQTGAVYATQGALARLIDKHPTYVARHAKELFEGDTNSEVFEAEILTEGGLQGVTLYDEDFICSLLMKYKPDLCLAAMRAGIRLYFHQVAGYTPTEIVDKSQKVLGGWVETRDLTVTTVDGFQLACMAFHYPANHVHDLITKLLTGRTAGDSRKLPLVGAGKYSKETIGLNHVASPQELEWIATAKANFARYRKGTWQEKCIRAADSTGYKIGS